MAVETTSADSHALLANEAGNGSVKRVDGRLLRSQRTRAGIIDATLALLESGNLHPTAQTVARHARVSLRAVFHHFHDMDQLLRAAIDTHLGRHPFDALPRLATSGTLEERVVAFANRRAATFERILPVHRSVLLKEHEDPNVAVFLQKARSAAKQELRRAFAAELREASDEDQLEALMAATSWCAWEALRLRGGLSFARARTALEFTLRRLLAPR